MNGSEMKSNSRAARGFLLLLAAVLAVSLLVPVDAEAQFFGGLPGYRWSYVYVMRHMEFGMAHSVMTDRVVFDDQGHIDLAMTDLHPLAVRDLFPYPWLYLDDQLREMNYNPILFWSVPYYLPSYDEMRRIYTLYGGYFFDPWGSFYGGFWGRAWDGYYGRFPYDMYWGWWNYNFYFVDYPYGGWWLSGHRAMNAFSNQVNSVEVQKKAGWPLGIWVREPQPSIGASADPSRVSVMETLVATGNWNGFVLPDEGVVRSWKKEDTPKNEETPRITRAYRDFLPSPGPRHDGRVSMGGGGESRGPSASSSGSTGSSGSSSGGTKRKTKKK